MRKLDKLTKPQVLVDNETNWLGQYQENPTDTNKTRYRHTDIKSKLVEETSSKCVYCESKIGHNTPGDIEHKKPISKFPDLGFDWNNLTIACTECNRRKNDYYSDNDEDRFLDPYHDDVETMLIHHGPVMMARPGFNNAEITVRILALDSGTREQLILRKIEKIKDVDERVKRYNLETDQTLKEVLRRALLDLKNKKEEYSSTVSATLNLYNL